MKKHPLRITSITMICMLSLFGCGSGDSTDRNTLQDSSAQIQTGEDWSFTRMHDTIQQLLSLAIEEDTILHQSASRRPFLYFRSGNFISESRKHAVVICSASDTTVWVDLYQITSTGWAKREMLTELSGPGIAFSVIYDDYNFDGITDLFIAESCSNGYSLCRGNLLITDSSTRFIALHPEANGLANMKTEPGNKLIHSDSVIWCKGIESICALTSVWKGGQLVTSRRDCPCIGD